MIEVSRPLLRRFRAVLRKSVLASDPRGTCSLVILKAGEHGLTLACEQGGVGLRYHEEGARPPASVALPASLLEQLEGNKDGSVALEHTAPFKGRARWQEGGEERVIEFDTADPASLRERLAPTGKTVPLDAVFLAALREASLTAAREQTRFALTRILLRGRDGAVIGTDGRQLLVHAGFALPWKDEVFIPSLPVFASRELPAVEQVSLGREGQTVTLEVGPWAFLLGSESSARYPDVDQVVPKPGESATRLRLHPDDVRVLLGTLPGLPGSDGRHGPVSLEFGPRPAVRAQDGEHPPAEVLLTRSTATGPAVRVLTDRYYLRRALQLGFGELQVTRPDSPLSCRDERRTYLWMPLDPKDAGSVSRRKAPEARPRGDDNDTPRREAMPPISNGKTPEEEHPSADSQDPVAEAEALRGQLHDALSRTTRLIALLKQQKRRSRAVESAVASLRKLRQFDD